MTRERPISGWAFAIPDLDREVKLTVWKYARQNGVHVSPTFHEWSELVQANMSSGDPVADWVFAPLS